MFSILLNWTEGGEVTASHDSLQGVIAECGGKKGKHHLGQIDSG